MLRSLQLQEELHFQYQGWEQGCYKHWHGLNTKKWKLWILNLPWLNSADLLSPPVITIDWTFLLVTDSIWFITCRVPRAKPWIAPKNRSSGVVSRFKPWIDPRIFGSARGDRLPWKSGMTRMSSSLSLTGIIKWVENTIFSNPKWKAYESEVMIRSFYFSKIRKCLSNGFHNPVHCWSSRCLTTFEQICVFCNSVLSKFSRL